MKLVVKIDSPNIKLSHFLYAQTVTLLLTMTEMTMQIGSHIISERTMTVPTIFALMNITTHAQTYTQKYIRRLIYNKVFLTANTHCRQQHAAISIRNKLF